ncbi:hypothetical protein VTH8203_01838 [Vibrio thalassae]|uniref:Uncharacterized protein n=1 Tax=Vibrio thalassae TaxID=1243014 RepID=A0A240EJT2_9VIBR|nr:hypothetical protein VTH8203_01838 [Vibrio thalassae]
MLLEVCSRFLRDAEEQDDEIWMVAVVTAAN